MFTVRGLLRGAALLVGLAWPGLADPVVLWEIGKPDHGNAEFALAPRDYAHFEAAGFWVVGEGDAARDWPYVHPGPVDDWAGRRSHTFVVLFGLKTVPAAGECRLLVDLLDTHSRTPPRLRVEVNGQAVERDTPPGAGDASVFGDPTQGRACPLAIPFPVAWLRPGDNELRITTLTGSWVLYDWLGLEAPPAAQLAPVAARTVVQAAAAGRALVERAGALLQPVRVTLRHVGPDQEATVRAGDGPAVPVRLTRGLQEVQVLAPPVEAPTVQPVTVEAGGAALAVAEVALKPVRRLTVYILPHSHTDIGYTEIQTAIEAKQVENLVRGMAYARQTADYPPGARFVWNVEVLWAADLYLQRLGDDQRAAFLAAVQSGQVALNGMYLNELTGLCRPEELLRLFRYSTQLGERCGVRVEAAMISDVPGYTWGTVTAMAQAGIRYFSTAPNYFDRIGTILREWENRPFWWVGPDGQAKVLVWIPFWGYAMSHRYGRMSPTLVDDLCDGLEARQYPYDIAHVRWSGQGDNAVPDPSICDFVRDWNATYAWPRFVISSTAEAFRALEARYGEQLPVVRGDWTPYWEDGAGSSALETAMNRASADRLTQAEALFARLDPGAYPAADFAAAWDRVLLYSEHTWGAWCSVGEPERRETREQWEIKRGYAEQADRQSRELLDRALASRHPAAPAVAEAVDVFNTTAWPQSGLVAVPGDVAPTSVRVCDDRGQPVPSQRLASGERVFLARDLPPLAARRYTLGPGEPHTEGRAEATGLVLAASGLRVRLDAASGDIVEMGSGLTDTNLVAAANGVGLNGYLYLPGDNLADLARSGTATVRPGETGPLVASLVVESPAPGCRSLRREVRVVAGLDYVLLTDTVDKARLEAKSYHEPGGKESVNIAFPFAVPGGDLWLDLPLAAIRPELDQMPSACKNWLTMGRWADVSSAELGLTWASLDAPLVQVGGITANLLNSQTRPEVWRRTIEPTQTLYAWVMNNHWGTNYRAYQEGPVVFRFALRPHRGRDLAEATRFATALSQPLLAVPARGPTPPAAPLLRLDPGTAVVASLKPADDGRALIVRLFGASGQPSSVTLHWGDRVPRAVFRTDTGEKAGERSDGPVLVPGLGVVSLRAEF